jgi:putative membrane protein
LKRGAIGFAVGCAALAWIVASVGVQPISLALARGGWALPMMAAVHVVQLFFSALAWRSGMGARSLTRGRVLLIRWVREGVNALLPVAQIGGQVAGARLLVRSGLTPTQAVAGTILDLTLEAASQLVFTLLGVLLLFELRSDRHWLAWVGSGLLLLAAGVAGFIIAQRAGLMRLVERGLERLAKQWPGVATWSLGGLHAELMRLQSRHGALVRATLLHTTGWSLGALEVWVALRWIGHDVSMADAFVIESLGMAARSAGFAVPGAVGVQEGGFVLVAGLFGISATDAVALSMLKRIREVVIGLPALLTYAQRDNSGSMFFFEKKSQKTVDY